MGAGVRSCGYQSFALSQLVYIHMDKQLPWSVYRTLKHLSRVSVRSDQQLHQNFSDTDD